MKFLQSFLQSFKQDFIENKEIQRLKNEHHRLALFFTKRLKRIKKRLSVL